MNISMFTNTYLPHVGGVARSVSTFAAALRALRQNVMVVAPTFGGKPDTEDEKHVLRVAAIQNFNGSDFSVRIPLPGVIEKNIIRFQPDIIHSHHPFLLGDAALRTAQRFDLPIVFTHHTLYEQYTHYVPFASDAMKRFVINLATEYANLCNCIIAPSNSIKRLLEKRGVVRPVVVLPTGIDLEFFRQGKARIFRKRYNIPADYSIIGHTGRLAREKNLPYLASAVKRFLKKNNKFFFVVAGVGDAEKEIKKIFAAENLSHYLIMPGILKGRDLADCYKAMDLFVFASKSETQGLVLMEAMAAGVPVIALRASGVSDVVEDRKNGRILRANCSEKAFADAIAEAFKGDEIEQWRRAAPETARRFSRRNCAERLLAIYEETIRKNTRPDYQPDVLDTLRKKVKVEWELLQEKASAMMKTLT
ncbi:MAG: glycosyltransferase [Desulfobulbaceae bacterium]|nr:glycosyltransferase [Desulfobulbaceae bacterium]